MKPVTETGLRFFARGREIPAEQVEPILRCLERLHRVQLNGEPVADLALRFSEHPSTGMKGVVAYLPVENLRRGENLLTVWPPPRDPGSKRPLEVYQIPFWR